MKFSWFQRSIPFFLGITLLALPAPAAFAQVNASQEASAGTVLAQSSAAFSGNQVVQRVQISGDAAWYAGSLEDSGTIILTATANGSSQMQLSLAASGQKTETQTGSGTSANCQWAGNDGVAHNVDMGNCWRPVLWFLPSFSLQPSLLPSNLGITDLGAGTVGSGANVYRHLQSQLVASDLPATLATHITKRSTAHIGLNPSTLLPAVLTYSVHPDNGASIAIAIEVHYSDYRAVNGVLIPFLIQRYVNGSLQLEIHVTSAEIN
jgi:hypothetical protein